MVSAITYSISDTFGNVRFIQKGESISSIPSPKIQEISPACNTAFTRLNSYRCNLSFFANNSSTVSWYISSGTQQSTGQTAAH